MSTLRPTIGRVVSVNLSTRKGVAKNPVTEVKLRPGLGVVGDAHSGPGLRQVSLLARESIEKQRRVFEERRAKGESESAPRRTEKSETQRGEECRKGEDLIAELGPGSFAENLTTEGIPLAQLPLGTRLRVGREVVLEISKIGKECHTGCAIFKLLRDCVMPREGVFAGVVVGGVVRPGDEVEIDESSHADHQ